MYCMAVLAEIFYETRRSHAVQSHLLAIPKSFLTADVMQVCVSHCT